ncbi:MAG: DUF2793 domain-containing protein [Paracoccus sp. (in: a-proteobacteria)]|nr:DUF2793 domain-containing protein [Paracoccus sp. (in: a-proteobacteria)]
MSETQTARCALPLLQPAQAQKHVTVNEALIRLDAAVNLVLQSRMVAQPPASAPEGQCWAVPVGASGGWAGHAGEIAVAAGNGWIFVPARAGMRAFVRDEGVQATHDGGDWLAGALTLGSNGSGLLAGMAEARVAVTPGVVVETTALIPHAALVIGATARVIEPLTGTLESWSLGSEGAADRFGSGMGKAAGSWARGMLSQPTVYWDGGALRLTAVGGEFAGGVVEVAVHWLELQVPRMG